MTDNNIQTNQMSRNKFKFIEFVSKPQEFFNQPILNSMAIRYIMIYLVGLAGAINKFYDKYAAAEISSQNLDGFYGYLGADWSNYWFIIGIAAIPSGYLIWAIKGWWYNMRLKLCEVDNINKDTGRNIMMSNMLIKDIPLILMMLISVFLYDNFYHSYIESDLFSPVFFIVLIVMTMLSILNSYRSVKLYYNVKGLKVAMWFLVLPIISLVVLPLTSIIISIM